MYVRDSFTNIVSSYPAPPPPLDPPPISPWTEAYWLIGNITLLNGLGHSILGMTSLVSLIRRSELLFGTATLFYWQTYDHITNKYDFWTLEMTLYNKTGQHFSRLLQRGPFSSSLTYFSHPRLFNFLLSLLCFFCIFEHDGLSTYYDISVNLVIAGPFKGINTFILSIPLS